MTQLYTDGEGGLNSNEAKDFLKRQGIELKVRAPEQHARYVERHGALLRVAMHLIEEQCQREGVPITIHALLAQALFCRKLHDNSWREHTI